MREGRVVPALHHLDYIARAITPTGNPIRYHARFFLARAERARGALRSNGELLDLDWVLLADVDRLNVIDVTRIVLDQARQRAEGRAVGGVPRISYRRGSPVIRYG